MATAEVGTQPEVLDTASTAAEAHDHLTPAQIAVGHMTTEQRQQYEAAVIVADVRRERGIRNFH